MATENILNTISQGTVITGSIVTSNDIRIEGKIVGSIVCKAKLVIGEKGIIEGNVDAANVIVGGTFKGVLIVRELLQLLEKGRINGDIFTRRLSIQVGGYFSGNCRMGDEIKQMLDKDPDMIKSLKPTSLQTSTQSPGGDNPSGVNA